jgi:hypothetical protein
MIAADSMSTAEICHTQVYCAPKTASKNRDLVREVIVYSIISLVDAIVAVLCAGF